MTGAEMKCIREFLGLTVAWVAGYAALPGKPPLDKRRLTRMELGQERVPPFLDLAVNQLFTGAQETVDKLVVEYGKKLDGEDPVVVMPVYRDDDEYHWAVPKTRLPALWHRMIAARVAGRLPALQLDYAIQYEQAVPPWERAAANS